MGISDLHKKAKEALANVDWPTSAQFVADRMREPSSWIGVTAAAGSIGLSRFHMISQLPAVGAVIGGIILIILQERDGR